MKLYLTGEPCTQQRHCYFVEGESASFIMDCGYQRCYRGDELPHLLPEQIRAARYLFLSHSHENQSGALPYLLSNGFTGRVVLTTETARQLPLGQRVQRSSIQIHRAADERQLTDKALEDGRFARAVRADER